LTTGELVRMSVGHLRVDPYTLENVATSLKALLGIVETVNLERFYQIRLNRKPGVKTVVRILENHLNSSSVVLV
jgi:hypothetical protein